VWCSDSASHVGAACAQVFVLFGTFLFLALLFFLMCPQSVLTVEMVKQVAIFPSMLTFFMLAVACARALPPAAATSGRSSFGWLLSRRDQPSFETQQAQRDTADHSATCHGAPPGILSHDAD